MRTSYATGRYQASEDDIAAGSIDVWAQPGILRGVVWAGGLGMTPESVIAYGSTFYKPLAAAASRFPVIASDLGNTGEFVNDTHLARIGTAKTVLQGTSYPLKAKSGKIMGVGASMGAGGLLAYTRANLANVACLALIVPLVSISTLWSTNRGGFTAAINAAYQSDFGRNYNPALDDATRDARAFASQLNLPIKIWAVTGDTTILLSEVLTLQAAAPNCEVVQIGGTHAAPTWPATFEADLAAFLRANA